MSIESISEAARAGLAYERMRLDAASRNIAAPNMPVAANTSATRSQVVSVASDFSAQIGEPAFAIAEQNIATRTVSEPGHPMADAQGLVLVGDGS